MAGTTPWTLPSAGTRFALVRPPGSGDAWLLSQFAAQARQQHRLVVAISADALDAQRLVDEIRYFDPSLAVRPLPDWETLPYDTLSPHQDLVSERLETLYQLSQPHSEIDVLVVSATSALYRLSPAQYVAGHTFFFKQGQTIDAEPLRAQLVFAGYQHVSQVVAPGEFAIRGGLIDLFPMGSALPYRLDLFGDQLDSIRAFDPDTQRGLYPVPEVRLLPGREFPIDEAARQAFRRRWRERIEGDPSRSSVYKDIGTGIASAGIEYYLPLFFEQTATLFDYLPPTSVLALHGPIEAAMARFWNETSERYRFLSRDVTRPILPPADLFLNAEGFFSRAKDYGRISLGEGAHDGFDALSIARRRAARRRSDQSAACVRRRLRQRYSCRTHSRSRADRCRFRRSPRNHFADADRVSIAVRRQRRLSTRSSRPMRSIGLGVAPLHEGFVLREPRIAVITETELYAASPRRLRGRQRERASNVEAMIRDLAELRVGDPVVHVEHGIGRYLGLAEHGHGRWPHRVSASGIRERDNAVRAGRAIASDRPLFGRRSRRRTFASTRQRRLGPGATQGGEAGARYRR